MRILMLGNSFTSANDLPTRLADLTGAEVIAHTRGGARLSEHLNPKTDLGVKTLAALLNESWDYVILQEMSQAPVVSKDAFLRSVSSLCEKIHSAHAVPILFATWAYRRDSRKMAEMDVAYDIMAAQLSAAYHEAAELCDALVADAGAAFYKYNGQESLYAEDGIHPSELGTILIAEILAGVIRRDQKKKHKISTVATLPEVSPDDPRLRLLYLYRILHRYTDVEHPLSTNQIRDILLKEYGITMHRTTLPSDMALLQSAGIPVQVRRSSVMLYHLEDSQFELAELKILIDAVESSKFITETKSRRLVEKLLSLTSENNAEKLKRHLLISGRVKSGNEKGYYIVDAINEAINTGRQISFFYTDINENKQVILRNDGKPYTVSPYTLIWSGDFYYMVGWYHEKARITVFRVDRILSQPNILKEKAIPAPADFNPSRYTKEVFSMYDTAKLQKVTLVCDNSVMKGVIDKFGPDIEVKKKNKTQFVTKVIVCPSPTFYGWVFKWGGMVKISAPKDIMSEYKDMINEEYNRGNPESSL